MQIELQPQDTKPQEPDDDFQPLESKIKKLSLLNKLSAIALPLSIFQIFTGLTFSFVDSSYFNIYLTALGLLSITMVAIARYWTNFILNKEEKMTLLEEKAKDRSVVLCLLLLAFIKFTTTPLLLTNISFHQASSITNLESISEFTMNLFGWTEFLLVLYSGVLVIGVFLFSKPARKVHRNLNFICNTVMFSSSFTLCLKVINLFNTESSVQSEPLSSFWWLTAVLALGGVCVVLALFAWFINGTKWKNSSFIFSLIMISTGIYFTILSGVAYYHADNIYHNNGDTGAENFFDVANWSLIASFNNILLGLSLLYYSLRGTKNPEQRKSNRNYKWLIVLTTAGLVCLLINGLSPSASIQESQIETNSDFPAMSAFDLNSAINSRLSLFTEIFSPFSGEPSNETLLSNITINVDANINKLVQEMLTNHTYDYIVLGLDQDLKGVIPLDQGKLGNSTQDFSSKFNSTRPQIILLSLLIEKNTKYVIVVYLPESATLKEREVFGNSILPQAYDLINRQALPVLISNSPKDLEPSNLVNYAFDWPQIASPQLKPLHLSLLRRENPLNSSQQTISSVVLRLKGRYIDTNVERALNKVIVGRFYRYVLLDWDPSMMLKVTKKAPKNTTYDDFLKDLAPGKSQIVLLDFQFQDKDVPVLISWNPEKIYSVPWQSQVYELILNEATNLNIPYYETHDLGSLAVDKLVDFLMTFWPVQVDNYSKYNSKQLLSIFENPESKNDPENLFAPLYQNKKEGGEPVLTEMLLRRNHKYLLFNEVQENEETKFVFHKAAPMTATIEDFLADVKGKGSQLALLYLNFLDQDKIVCLVMTEAKSLEKNYVNYARIASAAEVYDIPTAYVSSPENIDIEQLIQFTFAPEILHMLDEIRVDSSIHQYWKQFMDGKKHGYIIFALQGKYSQVKLIKAVLGDNLTNANFTQELTDKQPFFAALNFRDVKVQKGSEQPVFTTWVPQGSDIATKILYRQTEAILFAYLPGSEHSKDHSEDKTSSINNSTNSVVSI